MPVDDKTIFAILDAFERGFDTTAIAETFGLPESTVYNLLAECRA